MVASRLLPALSLLLVPSLAYASFSDVSSNHPNADAIAYVQEQGIVEGYSDGTYRPDQTINRAEFVKIAMLYKFGQTMIDKCETPHHWTDVQHDAWYRKYLCRGADASIIYGYNDGTFRPDTQINFVEAAKIVAIVDQFDEWKKGHSFLGGEFWYKEYVQYLSDHSAIPLSITSFDQNITRGEMAEMIYRLKTGKTDKPSQSYNALLAINHLTAIKTYKNAKKNYSIDYPETWQVREDGAASFSVLPILNGLFGAIISNTPDEYVFVGVAPTCPDLSKNFEPTSHPSPGDSMTINGRIFMHASGSDGAAGSIGETDYYASEIDATHCAVMATYFFHTTGDADVNADGTHQYIADEKQKLLKIVQSFRLQ